MSRSGNTPRRGARQVCPLGAILWSKPAVSSVLECTVLASEEFGRWDILARLHYASSQ